MVDVCIPARRGLCSREPRGDAAPVSHLGKVLELHVTLVVPEIPREFLLVAKQRWIVFRGRLTTAPASTSVPEERASL